MGLCVCVRECMQLLTIAPTVGFPSVKEKHEGAIHQRPSDS